MPISRVVGTNASNTTGTTLTTTGITTTTGQTLVVAVAFANSAGFTSITDSNSNTWTQIGTEQSGGGIITRMYYCSNATGGASHTFTLTCTAADKKSMWVMALGQATTSSFQAGVGALDVASPFSSGTVSVGTQPAGIVSFAVTNATSTENITWQNGDTEYDEITDGTTVLCGSLGFRRVTTTGNQSADCIISAGGGAIVYVAAFTEAASSTYTLTADTGSVTLTGNSSNLLYNKLLTAGTGTFALTGNNATLNYSGTPASTYTMSCSVGQFILNGQDAALTYSVPNYWTWDRVTGNQGYRIEWGQTSGGPYSNSSDNTTDDETITLTLPYRTTWYARVAALVGGTPQDWSAEKVFTSGITDLNPNVGTYTLTGNNANLLHGYRLTADTGSFLVTGNNTNLVVQRTMPASTGSFVLTGNDVVLNKVTSGTYTLTADTGSFALTGVNTNLLYNRALLASVGSFTLNGINTGLSYSNAPVSQYRHRQLNICMSISL